MKAIGTVIAIVLPLTEVADDLGPVLAPRVAQEAQMARNPKDELKEPPGGRALGRLRQFEDARRPADVTPGSDEEGNTATPRGTGGKRDKSKGRNDDAGKDR